MGHTILMLAIVVAFAIAQAALYRRQRRHVSVVARALKQRLDSLDARLKEFNERLVLIEIERTPEPKKPEPDDPAHSWQSVKLRASQG